MTTECGRCGDVKPFSWLGGQHHCKSRTPVAVPSIMNWEEWCLYAPLIIQGEE